MVGVGGEVFGESEGHFEGVGSVVVVAGGEVTELVDEELGCG